MSSRNQPTSNIIVTGAAIIRERTTRSVSGYDRRWTVRYFVVDTGGWFSGRRVVISPNAVTSTRWGERSPLVNSTRTQVGAPEVDTVRPFSRQQEEAYVRYYGWPTDWTMVTPIHSEMVGAAIAEEADMPVADRDDPHLRSTDEVNGYAIEARDGSVREYEEQLHEHYGQTPYWP